VHKPLLEGAGGAAHVFVFRPVEEQKRRYSEYMSRTYHHGDRRIRVRGVRRPTDLRRLARVLIDLEAAKAEAEAEAEYQEKATGTKRESNTKDKTGKPTPRSDV
jgi:hypothetical protein